MDLQSTSRAPVLPRSPYMQTSNFTSSFKPTVTCWSGCLPPFSSGELIFGLPDGSDGKRICLQGTRPGFNPWVRKISWRTEWQPTPVFLPGEFYGQRSLARYSPWGCKESDRTERLTHNLIFILHYPAQNWSMTFHSHLHFHQCLSSRDRNLGVILAFSHIHSTIKS